MSQKTPPSSPARSDKDATLPRDPRQERLARALRDNLLRRKAAAGKAEPE